MKEQEDENLKGLKARNQELLRELYKLFENTSVKSFCGHASTPPLPLSHEQITYIHQLEQSEIASAIPAMNAHLQLIRYNNSFDQSMGL